MKRKSKGEKEVITEGSTDENTYSSTLETYEMGSSQGHSITHPKMVLPFHGTNSKYKTTGTTLFGKEVQSKLEAVNEKSLGINICSGFSGGSFSRTSGYYCPF
jgi:hypothetical protein